MDKLRNVLGATSVLFATVEELKLITGKEPQAAAEEIIECGTEIVVCKRAGEGSEIITAEDNIKIPVARAEKVVDKTGAGDVYAAGFIAGLLMDLSLPKCGHLGSEAAALSISAYGREKYPDRVFLGRFLRNLEKIERG